MPRCLVLLVWLASVAGTPAFAQTNELELLRDRVKELERQVAELEGKLSAVAARTPTGDACGSPAPSEGWRDPVCWERLHRGMSRFAVLRLLGEPGKVSAYDGFERWEYPAALGARVNFNDSGELMKWRLAPPGSDAPRP